MSRKPTKSDITSWDDAVFDPPQFVRDMEELVDHYQGRKMLHLRTFRFLRVSKEFTPTQISRLRRKHQLSLPAFARLLNEPESKVRRWELGDRKLTGPAVRLLQILQTQPEILLKD